MPDTLSTYKDETHQFADKVSDLAETARESLADTAKTVKDKAGKFGRGAMTSIEESRLSAAGTLHNAASGLHDNAGSLPGGPDMARSAAEKVDAVAGYLKGHNTKKMMADLEALVKKNPVPSLLVAGALGFLLSRALRNN